MNLIPSCGPAATSGGLKGNEELHVLVLRRAGLGLLPRKGTTPHSYPPTSATTPRCSPQSLLPSVVFFFVSFFSLKRVPIHTCTWHPNLSVITHTMREKAIENTVFLAGLLNLTSSSSFCLPVPDVASNDQEYTCMLCIMPVCTTNTQAAAYSRPDELTVAGSLLLLWVVYYSICSRSK